MRFKRNGFLWIGLSILLLLPIYFQSFFNFYPPSKQYESFLEKLEDKSEFAQRRLTQIAQWEQKEQINRHLEEILSDFRERNISYFILEENKLSFWSENSTGIPEVEKLIEKKDFYQSEHSYYKKELLSEKSKTYIALIQLYRNYPIENSYLQKSFPKDFQQPSLQRVGKDKTPYPIVFEKNVPAQFYLEFNQQSKQKHEHSLLLIFFSLGLITMMVYFFKAAPKNQPKRSLYFIFCALLLRFFFFFFSPEIFADLPFFQPHKLAFSSFIPSIGDFFLHLTALFIIIYQINLLGDRLKSKWITICYFMLSFFFAYLSIELIQLSISGSQINFKLNNFFNLSFYSLVSLVCFCLVFIITVILFHRSFKWCYQLNMHKGIPVLLGLIYLLIIAAIIDEGWIYLWCIPVVIIFILDFHYKMLKKINLSLIIIALCSGTIAFWINHEVAKKDYQQAKNVMLKLAEERDPVVEYLFNEIQNDIAEDQFLKSKLPDYWDEKEQVDAYIMEHYFDSYWDRYNINLSLCQSTDYLYLNDQERSLSCFEYFKNRIRQEGDMVSSKNLFRLQNLAGRIDYIGEIPLENDTASALLFIEFNTNYFSQNEGYPELLLDDKSRGNKPNLSNYSYAVYHFGKLVFQNGDYNYTLSPKINELTEKGIYRYQTENFHHIAYQKHQNTLIILSSQLSSLVDFLTAFTYLLIIFSAIFFLFSFSFKSFFVHFTPNLNDFSVKIQIFLIASLLAALIFVGIGSSYYIKKQYQEKNIGNLKEKIRSIRLEFESKIGSEEVLTEDKEFKNLLSRFSVQLSNVFYTDINFYDLNGELYLSSRPEIFDKGLQSRRMNPSAFEKMTDSEKSEWVQKEKIGKLEYLSAYIPFVNYENKLIAYLNLPYFVKQGRLEEEISNFLVSVINIYAGIFVLTLFISLLLINQLSRPLLLIRKQISRLKLGSSIELIEWNSEDEIGALVKEYNRIAIELNESAEQLAKTERESAWREMAKQVAHEIKNPLTPMKLSIQHLQLASKSKLPDINERIKKTTETLIQQIEILNRIASAFSAFAKLPEKDLKAIDLIPLIKNVIGLYASDATIQFEQNLKPEQAIIRADKDQLLRLLNNLIKNAIQASEDKKSPLIKLSIEQNEKYFILKITDNGVGIPESKLEKIFEPNFTTKTSGTGLGLAMSKNIVEQMNGEIKASSKEGEWTTLEICFPIA